MTEAWRVVITVMGCYLLGVLTVLVWKGIGGDRDS